MTVNADIQNQTPGERKASPNVNRRNPATSLPLLGRGRGAISAITKKGRPRSRMGATILVLGT